MAEPVMRLAGGGGKKIPRRVNLTNRVIDAMAHPEKGRRTWVYDANTKGLALMVTHSKKTWYVYKKFRGEPVKLLLGEYPQITPDVARDMALAELVEMAKGNDPREKKKAMRKGTTLGELWVHWSEHAKQRHRPKTILTDTNRYDTCLKDWASKRVAGITEADCRDKHRAIAKARGKVTANRALQLLRRMLNFARIQPNPAGNKAVDFYPERTRDRFLQPEEIPRFFNALDAEPNETLRDFFYACLYTGQRRSNVAAMRWDELDLDRSTWVIPGERMKNGEPQRVHLTAPMVDLLTRRKADGEKRAADGDARYGHGFVFPSYRVNSKVKHLAEPKGAWDRLLKRAGLTDLRIHDLRRSLGSWAAMTGASLPIIGKALGHLDPSSTAIYARLNIDPVRTSVDLATAAILEAAKAKPKEKGKSAGEETT